MKIAKIAKKRRKEQKKREQEEASEFKQKKINIYMCDVYSLACGDLGVGFVVANVEAVRAVLSYY